MHPFSVSIINKMSIYMYFSTQYVVRKDFFTGIKAGEFSVYDTSEKNLYYRIESNYGIMQNNKVISYPSKQEIGRLQAQIKPLLYKAEISILDSQSNQWINGLIQQNFQLLGGSFNIDWNGYRITMETEAVSLTTKFNDANGQLLAQYRTRPASLFWTRKYDMQIFSNKYPEQIYLLGLAAREHVVSSKNTG
jgi:hypothetical protein